MKTDITVLLDRSGSMASIAHDVQGGFDNFVADQKKAPGEASLTLVQFDTEYECIHKAKRLSDIPPLALIPRGMTALLDAMGKSITETGERLKAMDQGSRPDKVVFVVITDGEENSSKEYTKDRINEMVKHQRDIYKWEFVFLGANQDAIQEGMKIGMPAAVSINYVATAAGVQNVFRATSKNLTSLRAGASDSMAWSAKDRAEAEDKQGGIK